MIEVELHTYRVEHKPLEGCEARMVRVRRRGIISIRTENRTEDDETTVDALLKKAEAGVNELGLILDGEHLRFNTLVD